MHDFLVAIGGMLALIGTLLGLIAHAEKQGYSKGFRAIFRMFRDDKAARGMILRYVGAGLGLVAISLH